MFDNIESFGEHWVCFLDEPWQGNHLAYTGDFLNGVYTAVSGPDAYWH